jgi:hypothetical protein
MLFCLLLVMIGRQSGLHATFSCRVSSLCMTCRGRLLWIARSHAFAMYYEFNCYFYAFKYPTVFKYTWDYVDHFLILSDFMDSTANCIMLWALFLWYWFNYQCYCVFFPVLIHDVSYLQGLEACKHRTLLSPLRAFSALVLAFGLIPPSSPPMLPCDLRMDPFSSCMYGICSVWCTGVDGRAARPRACGSSAA